MIDIYDTTSPIYIQAMIDLMYGENNHFLNNNLGAANAYLFDVIKFSEGLDKESKAKLIRVRELIKEVLKFQSEKLENFIELPLMEKFDLRETILVSFKYISIPVNILIEQRFTIKDATIDGYQKQTSQVFRILFHNVIETMDGNRKLTLEMEDSAIDNSVEVTITDTRLDAASESRQTKNDWSIGLVWAKLYLQACGGNLSYEIQRGTGRTFKVTLPKTFTPTIL